MSSHSRIWLWVVVTLAGGCGGEAPVRGPASPPERASVRDRLAPPAVTATTAAVPEPHRALGVLADQVEIRAVSVGGAHACALTDGAGVLCWGENHDGQLGGQPMPGYALTLPIDGVAHVAAGARHTCALTDAGAVWCWGANTSGQVGAGAVSPAEREPVQVSGLGQVVQLSVGIAHTCAVAGDGSVWCWGRNDSGELGDGTRVARPSPVRVQGLTDVRGVSAGGRHTCAVTTGGRVRCWGGGSHGQLGSDTEAVVPSPLEVPGLQPMRRVFAAHEHTCALDRGGGVWCWGNNRMRVVDPLAHEVTVSSPRLLALPEVTEDVAVGLEMTCATLDTGRVVCWGRGRPDLFVLGDYDHLSASSWATCGVRAAGVWCWSADFGTAPDSLPSRRRSFTTDPPKDAFEDLVHVAAGDDHACATTRDGDVYCWGANDRGQLGDQATADTSVAVPVTLPGGAAQLVAGAAHTCVLDEHRRVYCWGDGRRGQLGPRPGPGPARVPLGGRAQELAAHGDRTCAEVGHGQLRCWGGGEARPTTLAVVSSATGIAVGGAGVCATDMDGRIQCWRGERGEHWEWAEQHVDRPLVGDDFVCGLLRAGDLACWGDLARLGVPPGQAQAAGSRPLFVAHGFGTEQADLSDTHVCLLRRRAGIQCWGSVSVAPFRGLGYIRPTAEDLAVGNGFTCVAGRGRGVCWGRSDRGQLGGGFTHDLPLAHWIVDPRKRRE